MMVSFEQLGPGVESSLCGFVAVRCGAFYGLYCSLCYCGV